MDLGGVFLRALVNGREREKKNFCRAGSELDRIESGEAMVCYRGCLVSILSGT